MLNERGYALIACVLVITSMMLLAATGIARMQLTQQDTNTMLANLLQSQALAEGCADTALLELSLDSSYTGDETITIGSDSCTLRPVLSGPTTIETEASKNGSVYRLRIELSSSSPVTISSWERVSEF